MQEKTKEFYPVHLKLSLSVQFQNQFQPTQSRLRCSEMSPWTGSEPCSFKVIAATQKCIIHDYAVCTVIHFQQWEQSMSFLQHITLPLLLLLLNKRNCPAAHWSLSCDPKASRPRVLGWPRLAAMCSPLLSSAGAENKVKNL